MQEVCRVNTFDIAPHKNLRYKVHQVNAGKQGDMLLSLYEKGRAFPRRFAH